MNGMRVKRNKRLFDEVCRAAYNSVYWSRKNVKYRNLIDNYAPMIKDDLFLSIYDSSVTVGSYAIEMELGRRLRIEELTPCLLSCNYLLFGKPLLTGSKEEFDVLQRFRKIILHKIRFFESRAINWENGRAQPQPVWLMYYDFNEKCFKRERAEHIRSSK